MVTFLAVASAGCLCLSAVEHLQMGLVVKILCFHGGQRADGVVIATIGDKIRIFLFK
jgi:hypothetical protein